MEYVPRIVAVREDHDETQRDLAKALGIAQAQWARYETSTHELPLRYLVKLCQHYQVSSDYLLGLPKGLEWPR